MVHPSNREAPVSKHNHSSSLKPSNASSLKPSNTARKVQKLYVSPGSLSRGHGLGLRPQKQVMPNLMLRNNSLRHRALYASPPGLMFGNLSDIESEDMQFDYIDNGDKVIDVIENEDNLSSMEAENTGNENLDLRNVDNEIDNTIDSTADKDNNEVVRKKTRGRNKNETVAKLAPGEKLEVIFFRKRAVGKNGKLFARHLGRLVRDGNMCPVKVHKWSEIGDDRKNHMWAAVLDKFSCTDGMESHREDVIDHMYILWKNWRGTISENHIHGKTLEEALEEKVEDIDEDDWKWLVKEHYFGKKFKEMSERNSKNRSGLKKQMLHRTGSQPFCDIAWEMGGKEGKEVPLDKMWRVTRSKGDKWATEEAAQKHECIVKEMNDNPQMSYIELVDKCFKPQRRDHVIGYGGGIRPKDLRGPCPTRAQLEEQLHRKDQQLSSVREELIAHKEETKADKDKMQIELKELREMLLRLTKANVDTLLNIGTQDNDDTSDNNEEVHE